MTPRIAWALGWGIPPDWFRPMAAAAFPAARHVLVEPSPATWDELQAAGPFDWLVGYSLGSLILLQNPERASALGRVALLAPIWAFPAEADAGGRVPRANLRALTRAYRNAPAAALGSFYQTAGLRRWSAISERAGPNRVLVPNSDYAQRARRSRSASAGIHPPDLRTEAEVAPRPKPETLEAFRFPNPQTKRRAAASADETLEAFRSTISPANAAAHLWGLEQLARISLAPLLPPNWSAWTGQDDALLGAARQQTLVPALTIVPGATHHPAELIAAFAAAST